jgi:hypothetical protein
MGACSSNPSASKTSGTGAAGAGVVNSGSGARAGNTGNGANSGGLGADSGTGGSAASVGTGGSGATTGTGGGAATVGTGGSAASVGTGGSAATTGTGGTGGAGGACAEASSTSTAVPPVLEFLIDISVSMNFTYVPSTFGATKWAATQAALSQAFAALPSDWAVGVVYYNRPSGTYVGQQAVPIAPLTAQQLGVIDTSLAGVSPGGMTPTLVAWQFARQQVSSWVAPAAYQQSPRYIVLITDGVPTINRDGRTSGGGMNSCITQAEYDYFIQTVTSETQSSGVKTFVIGVPGSDDPQGATYDPLYELSLFAMAGQTAPAGCVPTSGAVSNCFDPQNNRQSTCLTTRGTYCLYDMTLAPDFTAGLVSALNAIASQVISCTYTVPAPPAGTRIDTSYVRVTYNPSSGTPRDLQKATDSSCTDGQWYFSAFDANAQPTQIDLCPDTCSTAKGDTGASIVVTFTCDQVQ